MQQTHEKNVVFSIKTFLQLFSDEIKLIGTPQFNDKKSFIIRDAAKEMDRKTNSRKKTVNPALVEH